jgi:hypothetical protein
MKSMFRQKFATVLLAVLPFASFAHEGHGHTHGFTIKHYMVEPQHAAATLLVIGVAIYFFLKRRERSVNKDA